MIALSPAVDRQACIARGLALQNPEYIPLVFATIQTGERSLKQVRILRKLILGKHQCRRIAVLYYAECRMLLANLNRFNFPEVDAWGKVVGQGR